ncbi:MAG: hypothetical protein P8166_17320 [Candidatus Thiodiazotropha sp.]
MNKPTQNQIDHWISKSLKSLAQTDEDFRTGFYVEEEIPIQSVHVGTASFYASLARAKFLNGDPVDEFRAEFAQAARYIMKSFTMAYDESDPDYLGEAAVLEWVCETTGIEGMNWALMSADFELAAEVAGHYRTRPDGDMLSLRSNRYANALALTLRDQPLPAMELIAAQFEDYKKKPPKSPAARNYYSLILALYGILAGERERFHEGIELQLKSYAPYARGEAKDTDEEFICDHAVALVILAQHRQGWLAVTDERLPKGLPVPAP